MKFKKIMSVIASAVMLSSTLAFAAAASYPEPFVKSGTENGAIVVGANAAVTDWSAAIDVQTKLNALVTSTSGVISTTGGDSYIFEKSSTKLQMGYGLSTVISADITDSQLPNLLKDGKYIDDDNDEFDYDQKITMANLSLGVFDDSDYKEDAPTVGIRVANGNNILNYTLDMSDEPLWTDLATSNLPLLGKKYYVLSTNSTSTRALTLLDSAVDAMLTEGETTTLTVGDKTYEVSVNFIGSTPEVKLEINGEVTNSLLETETQKIKDGSYIGIKDIMYTSKDTGVSKVEFSIGTGKLKLTNNTDVELNDNSISGLKVLFSETTSNYLADIKLIWNAKDDSFVAEGSELKMPGFEIIKLSWGGIVNPAKEEILVEGDGDNSIALKDFPLKDGPAKVNILYWNDSQYTEIGKDTNDLLRTPGGSENGVDLENGTFSNITFDTDTDDQFVISWNDTANSESYLARINNIKTDSGTEKATLQVYKSGAWSDAKVDATNGSTVTIGNAEVKIGYIDDSTNTVVVNPSGTGVVFSRLFSKEGLLIYLPWINVSRVVSNGTTAQGSTAAVCLLNVTTLRRRGSEGQLGTSITLVNSSGTSHQTTCTDMNSTSSYNIMFFEEDKDNNVGKGVAFNISTAGTTTGADAYISDIVGESNYLGTSTGFYEIGDSDVHRGFVYSALATEFLWDKSADQYKLKIIYKGDEVYGQVAIAAPETVITPGSTGTGGQVLVVKDSEVSSVKDKNLFVVGGSCINSVAAKLLGSDTPICTEAFTEKTGVGAGQYIIKTVASPENAEKIAMLVAGYEAADTKNAVTKAIEGVATNKDTSQVYPITSA